MLSRNCISFEYLINPMLTYIFHVEKAFIWGMLANRGFIQHASGGCHSCDSWAYFKCRERSRAKIKIFFL